MTHRLVFGELRTLNNTVLEALSHFVAKKDEVKSVLARDFSSIRHLTFHRSFTASCLGIATRVSVVTHSEMSTETFSASFSLAASNMKTVS